MRGIIKDKMPRFDCGSIAASSFHRPPALHTVVDKADDARHCAV
jgi:hypothetical protein